MIQKYLDRLWVVLRYLHRIPSFLCLLGVYFYHPSSWRENEDWIISALCLVLFLPLTGKFFSFFVFLLLCIFLMDNEIWKRILIISIVLMLFFPFNPSFLFCFFFVIWSSYGILLLLKPVLSSSRELNWCLKTLEHCFFSGLSITIGF